jgi:hypothetical protein
MTIIQRISCLPGYTRMTTLREGIMHQGHSTIMGRSAKPMTLWRQNLLICSYRLKSAHDGPQLDSTLLFDELWSNLKLYSIIYVWFSAQVCYIGSIYWLNLPISIKKYRSFARVNFSTLICFLVEYLLGNCPVWRSSHRFCSRTCISIG